jgi:hypothetical protein
MRVGQLSAEENKQLVCHFVHEAVVRRNLDVLDEVAAGEFARAGRCWVQPFQSAFPDVEMEIVEVVAGLSPAATETVPAIRESGAWTLGRLTSRGDLRGALRIGRLSHI